MKKMVLKSIVFTVALCGAGTVAAIMAGASMKPKAIVDLNPDSLAAAELFELRTGRAQRVVVSQTGAGLTTAQYLYIYVQHLFFLLLH